MSKPSAGRGLPSTLAHIPHRWAVPLLLLLFAACGGYSLMRESATFDETTHLPAGFTYLDRFDFRHNAEHPPLAKIWAAAPLWLMGRHPADYASPHWTGTRASSADPQRCRANQWLFGFEFLNGPLGDPERRTPGDLLTPARLAILALGLLLGLAVYAWAREMSGPEVALISLFLFCLSPTMLAHARLVTTDLPAALGFTTVFWSYWRFLQRPGWPRALTTGLALGGSLLVKFSTLLLIPLLTLAGALWMGWPHRESRPAGSRATLAAGGLVAVFGVAYLVLWAGYGFRYSAVSDPEYRLEWETRDTSTGLVPRAIGWARSTHALPEAYLFGLAYAEGGSQRRLAFLNGEESVTGWWYYFPEAFLLKTPLPFIALLVWVAVAGLARTRGRSFKGWYLAIPVLFYLAISMSSHLNIGHRHLVPIYPLLFVGAGGAARLFAAGRGRATVARLLLAGCALSFIGATPGYLGYFNVLAGGARGGWRYLVDSNIDWGQDLPSLKRWMDANRVQVIHLAYFGTADPKAYDIAYKKVLMVHDFRPEEPFSLPGPGELFAVSVTLLQGVYFDRDQAFAEEAQRRGWISRREVKDYLAARDAGLEREEGFLRIADWLVARGTIAVEQRREAESVLLSTWLDGIREKLTPIGRAGDSILIYRIP